MSTADEIAKLHQLVEKGALTQAEFEQLKARLLSELPGPGAGLAINRLRRSLADRWIAGVCGGIGRLTGVESWVWRLLQAWHPPAGIAKMRSATRSQPMRQC